MLSEKLLDAIQAEADALHVKGATAISLLVRTGLTERKKVGRVPDERTQTYWVAGRFVAYGHAQPFEGVAEVQGLNSLAGLLELSENVFEAQIPSQRVNLSRKGEAHFQHVTAIDANQPSEFYDLWVFPTEEAATLCAQSLKAGKIF